MKLTYIYFETGDWTHIYAGDTRVYVGHDSNIYPTLLLDLAFEHNITAYSVFCARGSWTNLSPLENTEDLEEFFNTPGVQMRLEEHNEKEE